MFVALALVRVDATMLAMPFVDRVALAQTFDALPDGLWPGYRAFLVGVRAHTEPGDAIALAVPGLKWDGSQTRADDGPYAHAYFGGYAHAYFRASYFLAGREVLPLVLEDDRPRREHLVRAKYVALWGQPAPRDARVAWLGAGGFLLEQP